MESCTDSRRSPFRVVDDWLTSEDDLLRSIEDPKVRRKIDSLLTHPMHMREGKGREGKGREGKRREEKRREWCSLCLYNQVDRIFHLAIDHWELLLLYSVVYVVSRGIRQILNEAQFDIFVWDNAEATNVNIRNWRCICCAKDPSDFDFFFQIFIDYRWVLLRRRAIHLTRM